MINIMKFLRANLVFILLFIIALYKGIFTNIINNVSYLFVKHETLDIAEVNILREENNYLKQELLNISKFNKIDEYNYVLTRLTYRSSYNGVSFYINKGISDDIKVGSPVINNEGLVGIIKNVYDTSSEVVNLKGISNLSVNIEDNVGTLLYDNGCFIVKDIVNDVAINTSVYTSTYGSIKEKLFIGTVESVENINNERIIYIKSNVDFNDINYLYVVY